MRRLTILSTFLLLAIPSYSQDSTNHFEFASTLVTMNSFKGYNFYAQDRPQFEFINGLILRYHSGRHAVRAIASFSENYTEFNPPPNWFDAPWGRIHNKDFRIGMGVQQSIVKQQWLYLFADGSFRHLKSSGESSDGWGSNYQFIRKSNGLDLLPGIGGKIKLSKKMFLSPECGYNMSFKFVRANNYFSSGSSSIKTYKFTISHPLLRLHLTFKL